MWWRWAGRLLIARGSTQNGNPWPPAAAAALLPACCRHAAACLDWLPAARAMLRLRPPPLLAGCQTHVYRYCTVKK